MGSPDYGDKDHQIGEADPMHFAGGYIPKSARSQSSGSAENGVRSQGIEPFQAGPWRGPRKFPRKLPNPGPGKDVGGSITYPKNLGRKLSLIPTGFVIVFDVYLKTNWGSLASIMCALFLTAFMFLVHWYIAYPVLWWMVDYFPTTKRLLSENKHLKDQNQKLLQQVGQQSEYR